MKKIFSVLLFLVVICQIRAEDTNITTMRKMTQRLFPQQASFFDFRLLNDTSTDTFTIKSEGNKIIISGNNANSYGCRFESLFEKLLPDYYFMV